eukprot:Phypoly_transcript_11812.p1 GENE.Phypoly_transcript_11812~~Phypoly_transcript_11812.p1  ORF type:complete len:351 (-),score=64.54 Phypoly_transcript_11812:14-1066(-)
MAQETIPRGRQDPNYRYMMPALLTKVEGKGKGNTVLTNIVEVSKSLARLPVLPTKFFGFELGTPIIDAHGKYIVKGNHPQHKMVLLLDDFIDRFVTCKNCDRNPETFIIVHNDQIDLRCASCGGVTPVDMNHKLSSFILKNPPPPPPPNKMELMVRLMEKDREKQTPTKKTSKEKRQQQTQSDTSTSGSDDDVVWHADVSRQAAEQTLLSLRALVATSPSHAQILSKLQEEKEKHGFDDTQVGKLIFLALFDSSVLKQIQSDKIEIVKQAVANAECQAGLLAGLTELAKKEPAVQEVVSHVLQHLYLESVISEEVVMHWHATKSHGDKRVKQAASVFVQWLANAEEEDSD